MTAQQPPVAVVTVENLETTGLTLSLLLQHETMHNDKTRHLLEDDIQPRLTYISIVYRYIGFQA